MKVRPLTQVFLIIPVRYQKPKQRLSYKHRLMHRYNYGALVYEILERHRKSKRYVKRNMGPIMAKKIDLYPHHVVHAAYESFMYQVKNHNTPHPNYFIKVCDNNMDKAKNQARLSPGCLPGRGPQKDLMVI